MNSDTTSINDLPVDNNTQNVKLDMPDTTYNPNMGQQPQMQQPQMQQPQMQQQGQMQQQPQLTSTVASDVRPPDPLTQNTMNEMMSGLSEAQQQGMTGLPSKDIPMNQSTVANDAQTAVNYVPGQEGQGMDYIGEVDTTQQLLQQANSQQLSRDKLEYLYQEFQIPILISLLFFIFQLPVLNSTLLKYLPKLFNSDGNIKATGILCKTSIFGMCYYIINKLMVHLSKI